MKAIHYRGALLTFRLPDHWTEEYREEGGGTFFDGADESLTLRVNVLTMESPRQLGIGDASVVFEVGFPGFDGPVESLPNQQVMCIKSAVREHENGEALEIHTWCVARVVPPRTCRLAVFAMTVVLSKADAAKVEATLSTLRDEVRACTLSDAPAMQKPNWLRRLFG
jgi:hypothetical protein